MGFDLEDFKNKYKILQKKYKLPEFKVLNEDFEIEKIDRESDTMLRVVRKFIMEKIVNSMSFLEMLINPMNTHRMYLPYIKTMGSEDRKRIDVIYSKLAELSVSSLELEIDYDEKKEADLIILVFSEWEKLKEPFRKILGNVKKPAVGVKKENNGYFG